MRGEERHPDAHIGVLVLALVILFLIWLFWLNVGARIAHETLAPLPPAASSPNQPALLTQLGETGDAFGGLNALFAAVAGAFVAWAGYLQNQSLKQARAAYEEERKARQKQEFESTFFKMLELSRALAERIESRNLREYVYLGKPQPSRKHGAAALDHLAASIATNAQSNFANDPHRQATLLVSLYGEHVYAKQPSALGPFFRLLFQLFKVIEESGLDEAIQIRYANIARGQLSEGTSFLLALNGLAPRGRRFVRYIEKYGLLEHMHSVYKREFKDALRQGYRERAFLGSKRRPDHLFVEEPLRSSTYFVGDKDVEDRIKSILHSNRNGDDA